MVGLRCDGDGVGKIGVSRICKNFGFGLCFCWLEMMYMVVKLGYFVEEGWGL